MHKVEIVVFYANSDTANGPSARCSIALFHRTESAGSFSESLGCLRGMSCMKRDSALVCDDLGMKMDMKYKVLETLSIQLLINDCLTVLQVFT